MQQKKRRLGELSQMFTTAAFVFHQHFSKMKTCLPVLNLIPGETKKMCRYWMAYSLKLGMKSVLSELEIQQRNRLKKKKKNISRCMENDRSFNHNERAVLRERKSEQK